MRVTTLFSVFLFALCSQTAVAQIPEKYQPTINKGTDWLVKQQAKDGHWAGKKDRDAILLTSLAGLALFQEGSTPFAGKYAANLEKAVEWLQARCQPDGRIGPPQAQETAAGLMDHAFALRFLAMAYGDEARPAQRIVLKNALTKAVYFSTRKQTSQGGWSHKKDRTDLELTIAMLHALREARDTGIPVPKAMKVKAEERMQKSTTLTGAVAKRVNKAGLPKGGDSAVHTAGALACMYVAAGTQVSDLRNDYGQIRVVVAGERLATGLNKVGAFIGDHTKTGLNTLINCGTMVGAFCSLLPTGSLQPQVVPSFCRVVHGQLQEWTDLRQIFTTANTVMRRRDCELSEIHTDYLFWLFEKTADYRQQVIRDSEQRRMRRSV